MKKTFISLAIAVLAASAACAAEYAFSGIVKKADGSPVTGKVKVTAQFYAEADSEAEGGEKSGLADAYAEAGADGRIAATVTSMANAKRYPYLQWRVHYGDDFTETIVILPRQHVGRAAYALVAGNAREMDFSGKTLIVEGEASIGQVTATKKVTTQRISRPSTQFNLGEDGAGKFTFANLDQSLSMKPDTTKRLDFLGTNRTEIVARVPCRIDGAPVFRRDIEFTAPSDGIATVKLTGTVYTFWPPTDGGPSFFPIMRAGIEILDPSGNAETQPSPLYQAFHDTYMTSASPIPFRTMPWIVPELKLIQPAIFSAEYVLTGTKASNIKLPVARDEKVHVALEYARWDGSTSNLKIVPADEGLGTNDLERVYSRCTAEAQIDFIPFGGAR